MSPSHHKPTAPKQQDKALRSWRKVWLLGLCLIAALGLAPPTFTQASGTPDATPAAHVLLLNSYSRGNAWSDELEQSLRLGLTAAARQIELSVAYLDTRRFPDPENLDLLAVALARKYRGYPLDLVVVSDNAAFAFAMKQRATLFPNVPIVFCGFNSFRPLMLAGIDNVTGVNEETDIAATVVLALKVQPATHTLVFILSTEDLSSQRIAETVETTIVLQYHDRYEVVLIKDAPMTTIRQRLAALPAQSVVFLAGQTSDQGAGRALTPEESGRLITAASPVPVYTFWDSALNTGVLGGHIVTGADQGQAAAALGVRILNGTPASAIPVIMETPASDIFDFTVMRRFGLSERDLPADAIIINRPESLWDTYRWQLLGIIVLLIGETALILFLSTVIRQRRAALRALAEERSLLEHKVLERTAALRTANHALTSEIAERQQIEASLREAEQRFRHMFERHHAIMLLVEPHSGLIVDANPAATQFYGYPLATLRQMNIEQINCLLPEQTAAERERALAEKRNYFIFPHRLANGEIRTVEVHSSPIEIGAQTLLFSVIHDITERTRATIALRESETRLRSYFELPLIGIAVTSPSKGWLEVNASLSAMLGYSAQELMSMTWAELTHLDDLSADVAQFNQVLADELDTYMLEKRFIRKDGHIIWTNLSVSCVREPNRTVKYVVALLQDITERKQAEVTLRAYTQQLEMLQSQLREQAIRDPLTGAFNRRYLIETLEQTLASTVQNYYPLCLLILDLDHFKNVNDTYGHLAGDYVLQNVTQLLQQNTRKDDVVCRYGGEEFVVLLHHSTLSDALHRAEAWRSELQQTLFRFGEQHIAVTVSIGVASSEKPGFTYDELLTQADQALFVAKANGRNCVVEARAAEPPKVCG
ncbi:MAG: diguanylate cyclase [Chloroflexales bacterium]